MLSLLLSRATVLGPCSKGKCWCLGKLHAAKSVQTSAVQLFYEISSLPRGRLPKWDRFWSIYLLVKKSTPVFFLLHQCQLNSIVNVIAIGSWAPLIRQQLAGPVNRCPGCLGATGRGCFLLPFFLRDSRLLQTAAKYRSYRKALDFSHFILELYNLLSFCALSSKLFTSKIEPIDFWRIA